MIIHSPQDGAPPLSIASQEGHEKVVRVLLESGAQELPDKVRVTELDTHYLLKLHAKLMPSSYAPEGGTLPCVGFLLIEHNYVICVTRECICTQGRLHEWLSILCCLLHLEMAGCHPLAVWSKG